MTQQPWGQPQQQYQPTPPGAYQAMGYPPQQQAAAPPPPPDAATMFDHVGDGLLAPSYRFDGVGDFVQGEVVRTKATYVTDMKTQQPIYSKPTPTRPAAPYPQLNVVLQTDYRNWEKVKRVPTQRNADGSDGAELPASEDTGLRQIYVKYDMMRAVGVALREAGIGQGVGVQNGAHLAVALTGQRPPKTPGDNPLPLYQAKYTKPAVSDTPAFDFGQQQAPAQYNQGGQLPQGQIQQGPPQGEQVQQPAAANPWAAGPPTPPAPDSPWGNAPVTEGPPPF